MTTNGVSIPPERARAAQAIAGILQPGGRVALTTHVNADGDGVGSEVALWHLLRARGLRAGIANPTPIPERFDFLLPPGADRSDRAAKEIESADVVIVLDISDLGRLGDLQGAVTHSHAVACIDHHVSPASLPAGPRLVAPEASATAELVFDLAGALGWELTRDAARALYVGILTDTGAFRFANTSPRVLRVAGALLECRLGAYGDYVAELAHQFGGGGHQKAAGASFEGTPADVQEQVLEAARAYLRRRWGARTATASKSNVTRSATLTLPPGPPRKGRMPKSRCLTEN